jgi:hypothetical protein
MSKQNRQKLSILIVLLVVLGLTIVLAYRMNEPETTSAVQQPQPPAPRPPVSEKAPAEAKLRLDLVEKENGGQGAGKRDVFQYQQTPPPAATSATQRGSISPGSRPDIALAPVPPRPPGPPSPPPPPPIPLKYQGYAVSSVPGGAFTAFLADDSRHYNVTVGEVLMGRYRILGISDKTVDVEDLEFKRRQSLPIVK